MSHPYPNQNKRKSGNSTNEPIRSSLLNPNNNRSIANIGLQLNEFVSPIPSKNLTSEAQRSTLNNTALASLNFYPARVRHGNTGLLVPTSNKLEEMISDPSQIKILEGEQYEIKQYLAKKAPKPNTIYRIPTIGSFIDGKIKETAKETKEQLVPIILDIEMDSYTIKDQFLWNLQENDITPTQFADIMCQDLDIPSNYNSRIVESIQSQLDKFKLVREELAENQDQFIEREAGLEILVPIELDIKLGEYILNDSFLFSINSLTSPLQFSTILANDLALGGEFIQQTYHAILYQIYLFDQCKIEALPFLKAVNNQASSAKEMEWLILSNPNKNLYLEALAMAKEKEKEMIQSDHIPYCSIIDQGSSQSNLGGQSKANKISAGVALRHLTPKKRVLELVEDEAKARVVRRRRDGTRRISKRISGVNNSPSANSPYVFD